MKAAYANLKQDLDKVMQYLKNKVVNENEIIISQINTGTSYKKNDT